MEFTDNTGHIFSLPSYSEKPIGYEYDEYPYIFWIDALNSAKLSVNNYYSRPIYALYELKSNITNEDLANDEDPIIEIEVYIQDSNVFKLISSKEIQNFILSDKYTNLNDYIDLNELDTEDGIEKSFIKTKLTNDDLYVIRTDEELTNSTVINYLMIPIYPIAMAQEEGTWITNIMIHINDKSIFNEEWSYISVGGEFINEYEELIINGTNNGIKLPKDILKAVYSESVYNDVFNEAVYNEKLKEYLLNMMGIKGECGNFNSAIKSLKWFGYGDRITISKLLKTDNDFKAQYIYDYFNISNDVITSFKTFITDSLIALTIMLNKESDELYPFEPQKDFYGENKPKMISLMDSYIKVKIGNHDMPIENDDEKYWYWKPYFDFSFTELGIKLICLKNFYKKYFLPIHLSIHNASLGYRVFTNDIKLSNQIGYTITQPSIMLNNKNNEVEFTGNGVHYFTKQIHLVDDNFNEFTFEADENDPRTLYYIDDTCVNIPIKFMNDGYYNCVLLLQFKDDDRILFEKHFSFVQTEDCTYKNFIIFPKKFNVSVFNDGKIDVKTNYYEYWINRKFIIKLLVNNKWYEYEFELKINKPTIDFGKLRYRYYFNDHNYFVNKIKSTLGSTPWHSIIYASAKDINKITNKERVQINTDNIGNYTYDLYNLLNLEDERYNNDGTYINTIDCSDDNKLYQFFAANYNIYSPFSQLKNIDNDNKRIVFNSYMHNKKLATMNEINFDINFYKILQYHLDNNLMYIDGTLLDNEFYQYIIFEHNGENIEIIIHKDLIGKNLSIPTKYFNSYKDIMICTWSDDLYILSESGFNDDTYVLRGINELYLEEDNIDETDMSLLAYDAMEFEYRQETNSYWRAGKEYIIYDKLHSNTEAIYSKYSTLVNMPNNMKYRNNIHLFGLYHTTAEEHNILFFHNNIHMYANGIRFDHDKYVAAQNENAEDESLKFYISKNLNDNVDTRYIDMYGLEWVDTVPIQEIKSNYDQYSLYVKRDYKLYYEPESQDNIPNSWELPDIEEYDTNEFSYYLEEKQYKAFTRYYKTLDDFYKNNKLTETQLSEAGLIEFSIDDAELCLNEKSEFYFEDPTVKDLSNLKKKYKNKCNYEVIFLANNTYTQLTNVSIRDIESKNYGAVKVNFYYHKPHIVRNRFYTLNEFMNNFASLNPEIYESNGSYYLRTNNTNKIKLVKTKEKYRYNDIIADHEILNQNPSMYWYNANNNSIVSLPTYLNELERYAYDASKMQISDIKEYLNTYINKNIKSRLQGTYINDQNEVLFNYINYLEKDFTGSIGKYRIELQTNIPDPNEIRLLVEVIDNELNIQTYDNINNPEFVLDGNENKVTLYIQILNNEDAEYISNTTWFIPKLIKITDVEERLKYDYKKCGGGDNPTITVKFLNKEYSYGNNDSEYVYNLYNDFFKLKFNIYDSYLNETEFHVNLLGSVYDVNELIKLNSWLTYDFYLMHDNQYWYGLYISKQTCDKIRNEKDLLIDKTNKIMRFDSATDNEAYILKYEKTSQEYLINRLEFISSNGINHFNDDDIVCCYIHNNDVLPFNSDISSKWSVTPMSIGMNTDISYESNGEMTVISLPMSSAKYQHGYYKVTVRYSLDRDIQHQFKNTSTILIK